MEMVQWVNCFPGSMSTHVQLPNTHVKGNYDSITPVVVVLKSKGREILRALALASLDSQYAWGSVRDPASKKYGRQQKKEGTRYQPLASTGTHGHMYTCAHRAPYTHMQNCLAGDITRW